MAGGGAFEKVELLSVLCFDNGTDASVCVLGEQGGDRDLGGTAVRAETLHRDRSRSWGRGWRRSFLYGTDGKRIQSRDFKTVG